MKNRIQDKTPVALTEEHMGRFTCPVCFINSKERGRFAALLLNVNRHEGTPTGLNLIGWVRIADTDNDGIDEPFSFPVPYTFTLTDCEITEDEGQMIKIKTHQGDTITIKKSLEDLREVLRIIDKAQDLPRPEGPRHKSNGH